MDVLDDRYRLITDWNCEAACKNCTSLLQVSYTDLQCWECWTWFLKPYYKVTWFCQLCKFENVLSMEGVPNLVRGELVRHYRHRDWTIVNSYGF